MPNEIIREIKVKGDGYPMPAVIHYVQLTNAIPIVFHIRDYAVPTGAEARIYIRKPSGKEIYNAATITGNAVTVNPTTQMFAECGEQTGQIQILAETTLLVSFPIIFDVESNIISDSAVESTNEYTVLEHLIQDARKAVSEANSAVKMANTAARKANTAAGLAETAAGLADKAMEAANIAAGNANTAAGEANKSATIANQSKENADAAAKRANDAAKLCEGIASGLGITEILERIGKIETAISETLATE